MEKWYFTFGCGQKFAYSYVVIHAVNFEHARACMFKNYNTHWCGQYLEEQWNSPRNLCKNYTLLKEIKSYE